jgi:acyl carrier protein
MKMATLNDIIQLIIEKTGTEEYQINAHTDISDDLGVDGDDFHELIEEYAQKYQVDMTNYLWYFHTDEEGQNIGGLFFEPPYERVTRIPVTPLMLEGFANTGKWAIEYPAHHLPKRRYDLIFNQIILLVVLAGIVMSIIWR